LLQDDTLSRTETIEKGKGFRVAAASIHFEKRTPSSQERRKRAGRWLKEMRQQAGLSQLDLAQKLGLKYYTFISQVENGFGRVPSDSMEGWAVALGLVPTDFARHLLSYYDPDLHRLLFGEV
jgi:DNA-binding XRE family transcriptional regulator